MKCKSVYIWMDRDQPKARATIEVPGLGEVQIDSALSESLVAAIRAESVAALRVKLGQVVVSDEDTTSPRCQYCKYLSRDESPVSEGCAWRIYCNLANGKEIRLETEALYPDWCPLNTSERA